MKVFVIAGEASGDRLGAALMAGFKVLRPDIRFQGIGGVEMQAQGLKSLFSMHELSVMGLVEILPKYFALKRRIRQTAEAIIAARPDVVVTIDSPDFCLRVAALVKAGSDIRIVHYVAPSVWAWRPKRAQKMVGKVDQVLALLPFEPPYMQAVGIPCDFVGHPVVAEPVATADDVADFRQTHDLDGPILMVLPGSRRGEIARLAPRFGVVVDRVTKAMPTLRVVLPVAPGLEDMVTEAVSHWHTKPLLLTRASGYDKHAAFAAADFALAASGTVSLELAAAETPMIIAYDMAPLSRFLISRLLRVDTVTLVNLVSNTRAVPEFIGKNCRPEMIAHALMRLIDQPRAQDPAMKLTMERLGQGREPPGLRAARAVMARL